MAVDDFVVVKALHDHKRFVQVYNYVAPCVPMLARMYERRLRGYNAIRYVIERPPSTGFPADAER